MSKLPCEVVRDLFPSYIDELTSEVTKELVDVACPVEVEDNLLTIKGAIAEERLCISDVKIEETDGVVTISFESVRRSLFLDNSFEKTYTADKTSTRCA